MPDAMWDTLPAELWRTIFDILPQNDHISISRLSRRLHWLVQPILYSEFNWVPARSYSPIPYARFANEDIRALIKTRRKSHDTHPAPWVSAPSPYLLLRTLVKQPWLAKHFKRVTILALPPDWGTFWDRSEARELGFTKEEFEFLERTITRMQSALFSGAVRFRSDPSNFTTYFADPYCRERINSLHKGRLDLYVALVLSRMINLQTLDIKLRETSTIDNPIFHIFRNGTKRGFGQGFPKLTQVTITIDNYDIYDFRRNYAEQDPFNVDAQISKLFQLEAIQYLHINHLTPEWTLKYPLPVAAHLTKLKLHYGIMQDDELRYILQATPNLSELDVHLCYDADTQLVECDFLFAALHEVRHTLEKLVLELHIIDYYDGWDVIGCIEDLRMFRKLRHLYFPLNVLLGHVQLGWAADARLDLTKVLPAGLDWFQHSDLDDDTGRIQSAARRIEAEAAVVGYYDAKKWPWKRYWGPYH